MANGNIITQNLNRNFQAAIKGLPMDQRDFSPDIASVRASAFADGERAAAQVIRSKGNQSAYAGANLSNTGYGMAKVAAGGVVYTQPQFFSPIHTPINWQIPVKRKEQYQWSYLPDTQVLTRDFTYSQLENTEFSCNKIVEDEVTGGFIFEAENYPEIMNSEGTFNQPPRMSMRDCKDKRCFSFKAIGNHRTLRISEEHYIFVADSEAVRRNRKVLYGKKDRLSRGIVPNGIQKVKIQNELVKRIQAQDVKRKDYLLTPVPQTGTKSINKDLAWLIGFCVADGYLYKNINSGGHDVSFTGSKDELALSRCKQILEENFEGEISSKPHGDGKGWRVRATTKNAYNFFKTYIVNKGTSKKFSKDVFDFDQETMLNVLAGYFDGDGCLENPCDKNGGGRLIANCYSVDLADQLYWLLVSCKIACSLGKYPIYGDHYKTESDCCYRILVPSSQVTSISKHMNGDKVPSNFIPKRERKLKFFFTENGVEYMASPIEKIKEFLYTGKGFDIEMTNERHALVADGYVCSNSRFYYENEPKVATAVEFYSKFPINGFTNECSNRYVKHFFDGLSKNLHLLKWLRVMSHEVHLLGDCFPFLEVDCEKCNGSGVDSRGMVCEHENGSFKRLVILNPECAEVYSDPISPESLIAFMPNDELRTLIMKRGPGYERFSQDIVKMIMAGAPIPLDNRNVSHIKYCDNGYNKYGIGMIRRLFPILAYKTKLMTAQWIIAERLILPIKVAKVGSDERPASAGDLADINSKLAQVANDPNLTLVTHHAFELDWFGACTDVSTEVLTTYGWKKYTEVDWENGEKIATCDLSTGNLEFQQPEALHEYDYDGDMIHFKGRQLDFMATPNHKMVVKNPGYYNGDKNSKWEKIEAGKINKTVKFKSSVVWDGGFIPNVLPYKCTSLCCLDLDDYLRFLGFYISEGYIKIEQDKAHAVSISQNENSLSFKEMERVICLASKKVQRNLDDRTGNVNVQFYINNSVMAEEIRKEIGSTSTNKQIPRWVIDLPKEKLKILMDSLMMGDGGSRTTNGKIRHRYSTNSKVLAGQVQEIILKLYCSSTVNVEKAKSDKHHDMFRIYWSDARSSTNYVVKKYNIKNVRYTGKVWCFTVPNGTMITRRNGKIGIHGNSGKIMQLTNEFEIISQEILDGLGVNKVLLNGEGPTYSSAAIGVEVMIDKLDAWRSELSEWVEQKIYLPIAKMKGFIEKNEWGEYEYVYPKVKWDIMHLRDMQQMRTFILQLHEKGTISTQTMLKAFDIDYDQEVELLRYERAKGAQTGAGQQGDMGGGFGGMPDLGGMGAAGGGGDSGGLPEMGGGGDMGAGGGMPGGDIGGGAGGGASDGGMGASASTSVANITEFGGKVLKKKSREKVSKYKDKLFRSKEKQNEASGYIRDDKGRIAFTGPERTLLKELASSVKRGEIRHNLQAQFPVKAGGEEYTIDFSMPDIKLGIEVDGSLFHSTDEQIKSDKKRDSQLAQLGWTIVRFTDKEIENQVRQVIESIIKYQIQKENYIKQNMR